jgi:outer membrane protein insertion porin family
MLRTRWPSLRAEFRIAFVTPGNLLAMCLLAVPLAYPQARKTTPVRSADSHKLATVHVEGSQRYSPAEIMAAVGLHLGDVVSEDDFNRDTRDLIATGLFTDVAYTFSYDAAGTHLELKVADNDRLVPAHFENIVWFPDEELLREIPRRVPLFKGKVPLSGNLPDQVSDAIQAMLLERKYPGHVDYVRVGPDGGPIDAVNYAVDNVSLRVQQLVIAGASSDDLAALQSKLSKFEGHDYTHASVSAFANKELLPYYLARGYLKAAFGPPQPKVAQQTEDDTLLEVTLPLSQGPSYKLSAIEWSGNQKVSTDQLQGLFHFPLNQPANAVQVDSALREVEQLYGAHGYVRATVKPVPHFDEAQGTVAYELQVQEGDLYRMGELEIHGLDSKTTAQLVEKWAVHPGTPYDATYSKRFIEEAWKMLASHVDWTISAHEAIDDREKVVDISLVYGVQPSSH